MPPGDRRNNKHAGITPAVVEDTACTIADIRATAEAKEGLGAFLEKRKAAWIEPASRRAAKRDKSASRNAAKVKKQ